MIKHIAILFLLASTALAADSNVTDPMTVLNSEGLLVLSDGSSLYRFNKDGTLYSHPLGLSGRAFSGTWTAIDSQPTIFTAIANFYWQNGASEIDDYREITFAIYSGKLRPSNPQSIGETAYAKIFDCYFIIQELKKVPKPINAQQSGPAYPPQGVGSADP